MTVKCKFQTSKASFLQKTIFRSLFIAQGFTLSSQNIWRLKYAALDGLIPMLGNVSSILYQVMDIDLHVCYIIMNIGLLNNYIFGYFLCSDIFYVCFVQKKTAFLTKGDLIQSLTVQL